MASSDYIFERLSTVQNDKQATPKTIASASDISATPIETFITFVTGTTAIATITPPAAGQHMLVLIFINVAPGGVTTGGNILVATDPAQNVPLLLFYDPIQQKYYSGKLAVA